MNRKIWDIYAPVYELAMRSDEKLYKLMYRRIPRVIKDKDVLEIATGPGLLAKRMAPYARTMTASDYSEGMIRQARKGVKPDNLSFEVADAMALPYGDGAFDVVIIANALHVMPEPEKALLEIRRVLKDSGVLIAPNLVRRRKGPGSRIVSGILERAGVSSDRQWTTDRYREFLEKNGWRVVNCREMRAGIAMVYTECVKK